ncbi:Coat F domain-containing protein [Paenisporosarcina quisquiliarum]|jgi:spore coat protein CotF|uniref:Spore coat protein n=1 Tax=Psychrobacillus psychrodurans TaxID=126157 RepID=A0A9X3LBS3_9BACI|nr:spore coat protein [Psychrobacillus psychrodurans]MCZ8533304.1 spore coat protein [Psychrobacillus psychrodurans]SEN18406.1 Coat F domain-containing protein [Paenisporosarcina quisquiliarum]
MPNNIAERGLTDREMLQLCLELEKGRCRSISNTLLETKHPQLREIYKQVFDNASSNHYLLFEIMENKGWYKTELASKEQVGKVQELMQNNLHPDNQF